VKDNQTYAGISGVVCNQLGKQAAGSGGSKTGGGPCGQAFKTTSVPMVLLGSCGKNIEMGSPASE